MIDDNDGVVVVAGFYRIEYGVVDDSTGVSINVGAGVLMEDR